MQREPDFDPHSAFRWEREDDMLLRYEPEAGALYIRYREGAFCFTAQIGEGRYLDYSTDGRVLGIEVLDATNGVELDGLPRAEAVKRAIERLGLPTVDPGA